MGIYQRVREACEEKKVTVMRLEEKLGFSRGSIYKWDTSAPSVLKLEAVAKELDKPMEFFMK